MADAESTFLLVVTGSLITRVPARVRGSSPFMATDIVKPVFVSPSVMSPNRITGKGLVFGVDGGTWADASGTFSASSCGSTALKRGLSF